MVPLEIRLLVLFGVGVCAGALANWAIYTLAWSPRPISPWSPPRPDAPARRRSDRLPIVGWFGLRREANLHGRGFWIRPLLVELGSGAALAWLYWWEVERLGLIAGQVGSHVTVPGAVVWSQFVSHGLLLTWMLAATFIDIDEKIIPDEITVSGTVLALVLATLLPMSLLPTVAARKLPPDIGVALRVTGGAQAETVHGLPLWVEPTTPISPRAWPPEWAGPLDVRALVVALASYWIWCFALAPRIWRGRRGPVHAVRLVAARVVRELLRPPLRTLLVGGTIAIPLVWGIASLGWNGGEAAWCGLLSALVAMAGTGLFVWGVRIVCSSALRVEALGFGDVTLMMMIGAFLGWQACVITFFLAPIAGLVLGVVQFLITRDKAIPYGPFLCTAAAMVVMAWAWFWPHLAPLFETTWLVPAALAVCLLLMWAMLTIWLAIKRLLFGSWARIEP